MMLDHVLSDLIGLYTRNAAVLATNLGREVVLTFRDEASQWRHRYRGSKQNPGTEHESIIC
jgi:hypothetical protein